MINRQPLRGFHDFYLSEQKIRENLIYFLNLRAYQYGFIPLEVPIAENRLIYEKSIGEMSTLNQKNFFAITSKNEKRDMVLRPELTSGVVRAVLKSYGANNRGSKTFYSSGPCFRYEKPQKHRYRQFLQWNLETLWANHSSVFVFLFFLRQIIFELFGGASELTLSYNNVLPESLKKIEEIFHAKISQTKLCLTCQLRLTNKKFYQILDCAKCEPELQEAKQLINKILEKDNFSPEIKQIFNFSENSNFQAKFNKQKTIISLLYNSSLARGIDYYQGLVFELGQKTKTENKRWNSIIAGGHYSLSSFSSDFKNQTGIGFAVGIDRYCEIYPKQAAKFLQISHFFTNQKKTKVMLLLSPFWIEAFKNFQNQRTLTKFHNLQELLTNLGYQIRIIFTAKKLSFSLVNSSTEKANFVVFLNENTFQSATSEVLFWDLKQKNYETKNLQFVSEFFEKFQTKNK